MKGISAYILSESSRAALAEEFPPENKKFVGHHVTYQFGSSDKDPLPPGGQYYIVGYAQINDHNSPGDGLEAFVVTINGNKTRPDGGTYHITWSHGPSYRPKDSNELVSTGYMGIDPIEINMEPVFIPFN